MRAYVLRSTKDMLQQSVSFHKFFPLASPMNHEVPEETPTMPRRNRFVHVSLDGRFDPSGDSSSSSPTKSADRCVSADSSPVLAAPMEPRRSKYSIFRRDD
jgi:hypothetical protein